MSKGKSEGVAGAERAERLAQALRDNLRRRKAQSREAADSATDQKPGEPQDQ